MYAMKDRKKQIKQLFEGQLDPREIDELLTWLNTPAADEELGDQVNTLWEQLDQQQAPGVGRSASTGFEKLQKRLQQDPDNQFIPPTRRTGFRSVWIGLAASLTLILTLGFLFQSSLFPPDSSAISLVVKENPAGQKSKVHLPDGTIVHLNAESRVVYPESFTDVREVQLVGEAFFEVVKDASKPFSVTSGRLKTVALGTSFNIRAFTGEAMEAVTLLTGKVRVEDALSDTEVILDPLQEVIVQGDQKISKPQTANTGVTNWMRGVLVFKETPFKEVVRELERWYGVDINVRNMPPGLTSSGVFENEYLNNILLVLSHNMDFEYTLNGKQVEINF